MFIFNNIIYLVSCDTTRWTGSYEDFNRIRIFIFRQFGTLFRGAHTVAGADNPPLNGTLENDCSGTINFELLGGVQPFQYFPDNCSIVMSTTGNVFRARSAECIGNVFLSSLIKKNSDEIFLFLHRFFEIYTCLKKSI